MQWKHLMAAGAAAAAASVSAPACAQDLSGSRQSFEKPSNDRILLGIGAAATPVYQGADDYRVLPLPAIDIAQGPFFANFRNGVGVNLIARRGLTVGSSVTFMPGYRRRDVPVGVGRLSSGAGARAFASVSSGGVIATVGATQGFVGSTRGFVADASLSYPIVASRKLILTPSIATSFADRRHNDRYFGITAAEAQTSGLEAWRGKAGFKDASVLMTAIYRLDDRFSLSGSVGATTLLGRTADSPLVAHRTLSMGFLSLTYRLSP
ncbi:MAG: structural protein MipA [Novosphingobium lindaniclasticum]|jgi:outer membrane protein|uniref:MipA/OmpV family protein n=1 Tax=Novosphingobium lindaniclasticum TaxID=1329895 RepID=UPI0024091EB6|nr:MipA/OmpV family protein [Novosphingobium lindaniclasticum]MDF2640295.1 structural protein MipA [Novosphingobium lindaniclasticum]